MSKRRYEIKNQAFSISVFYIDITENSSIIMDHEIILKKDESIEILPIETGHIHRHYRCKITKEGSVLHVEYWLTRFMKMGIIICSILFLFSFPILDYINLTIDIELWLFWAIPSICLSQVIVLYFGAFHSMRDIKQKIENFILK